VPDDVEAEFQVETTTAFSELQRNLDYARDLVRGGRFLERLKVGAFDVSDLYRAAWVQAVSALDHWVHRELYDRALAFALQVSVERPAKFLRIEVPMSLFEDVLHHSKTMEDVFRSHLRSQYGHLSFQHPEKIKGAISMVSDASLWLGVAKRMGKENGKPFTPKSVQDKLIDIVKRRNRIAHETDRDHQAGGIRTPIRDGEVTETIDWLERVASAILAVIGPPPGRPDGMEDQSAQSRVKWPRQSVYQAAESISDTPARVAVGQLLAHADAHQALLYGGVSPEPSGGVYYRVDGTRRSLWSLYLTAERPVITVNLKSIWSKDQELAYRMVAVLRSDSTLDAALLHDDDTLVQKYPAIDLAKLGESPDALNTVIRVLDLVLHPRVDATKLTGG
jgi:hypothetical protein